MHVSSFVRALKGRTARIIAYILGSKIISHTFSIITGIVIARELGPEGKGVLVAIFAVPVFFSSFGHLGLPTSNIYFTGKKRDSETLFVNSIYFIAFASFIYVLIVILAIPILNKSYFSGITSQYVVYMAIMLIPLLLMKHFFFSFLRGFERYNDYNRTNILKEASRLCITLLFIFLFQLTIGAAVVALFISLLLSNGYSYMKIKHNTHLNLRKANRLQFKENLSYALRDYLGNLFASLNVRIDLLILAGFMDKASIGIYSVVMAISSLFQFIPNSIGVVLLPKISKGSPRNVQNIMKKSIISNGILLSLGLTAFLIAGRPLIPLVYGEQFSEVYSIAVIVLFGSFLLSFSQIINKYFSGIGKPEIKSIIMAITLPIKAASMCILITLYSLQGAAWSFVVTTGFLLLLSLYYYFKTSREMLTTTQMHIEDNDELDQQTML